MKTLKGTYPDGSKLLSYLPTTTKDLFRTFSVYGIHAFVMKFGNKYDICYPNSKEFGGPTFLQTGLSTISRMTLKTWLELADKNCPDQNRGTKDILWTNYKKYIENETL